jgi:hypothetical protein
MKNSISNENKFNSINNINFNNLNEAKGVILSISNELEFHQKETLKCAIIACGKKFCRTLRFSYSVICEWSFTKLSDNIYHYVCIQYTNA